MQQKSVGASSTEAEYMALFEGVGALWLKSLLVEINKNKKSFKSYLVNKFKVTDMKEVRYFIFIFLFLNRSQICLSQPAYIKNVLRKM